MRRLPSLERMAKYAELDDSPCPDSKIKRAFEGGMRYESDMSGIDEFEFFVDSKKVHKK